MVKRIIGVVGLAVLVAGCGLLPGGGVTAEPPPTADHVVATVPVGVTPAGDASGGESLPEESSPTAEEPDAGGFDPFAGQQPLSEVGFLMPPSVQHVTQTTAQIMFEFEAGQPGSVFYRPAGDASGAVQVVPLDPSDTRHILTLDGLSPGTSYDFIVRAGDGAPETLQDVPYFGGRWGTVSFRTPPYDPPLRFAVIGDSGFGEPITYSLGQQIADLDVDFMLHVGDIVYESYNDEDPYASYAFKYFGPFSPVLHEMPIYPAIGNHELIDPDIILWDRPAYYWVFPPISDPQFPSTAFDGRRKWYAFEANGVQFISLDTQVYFGDPGREEQEAWLRERLGDQRFDYSVAFFHVPPFSSSEHRDESPAVRPIADMLNEAGVPLAFSGHDHYFEHLVAGPTNYFITGGGSSVLYPAEQIHGYSQFTSSQSHFLLVEITDDGIEVRAIAADGTVFHEVSIPTPP